MLMHGEVLISSATVCQRQRLNDDYLLNLAGWVNEDEDYQATRVPTKPSVRD